MIEIRQGVWGKPSLIVDSMKAAAKDADAWTAYMQLTVRQKEIFREMVGEEFVVKLAWILREAPKTKEPPPKKTPVPKPTGLNKSTTAKESTFASWINIQARLVKESDGLRFDLGEPYSLSDGTVSVPICILRNGAPCQGTNFKFHFHPGAKKASVGHGHASQGHFKPRDGGIIRAKDHNFSSASAGLELFRLAKKKAKGK